MIFWTERIGGELYVYCNGELIMKRWSYPNRPWCRTVLFNKGWLPEWINEAK